MSKAAKKRQEQERARVSLRARVIDGDTVYTLTEYGRGETDYVRVFHVLGGEIQEITGAVATVTGIRFVNDKRFGLALSGGQYNKAHSVFDSLRRALDRDLRWRAF